MKKFPYQSSISVSFKCRKPVKHVRQRKPRLVDLICFLVIRDRFFFSKFHTNNIYAAELFFVIKSGNDTL